MSFEEIIKLLGPRAITVSHGTTKKDFYVLVNGHHSNTFYIWQAAIGALSVADWKCQIITVGNEGLAIDLCRSGKIGIVLSDNEAWIGEAPELENIPCYRMSCNLDTDKCVQWLKSLDL